MSSSFVVNSVNSSAKSIAVNGGKVGENGWQVNRSGGNGVVVNNAEISDLSKNSISIDTVSESTESKLTLTVDNGGNETGAISVNHLREAQSITVKSDSDEFNTFAFKFTNDFLKNLNLDQLNRNFSVQGTSADGAFKFNLNRKEVREEGSNDKGEETRALKSVVVLKVKDRYGNELVATLTQEQVELSKILTNNLSKGVPKEQLEKLTDSIKAISVFSSLDELNPEQKAALKGQIEYVTSELPPQAAERFLEVLSNFATEHKKEALGELVLQCKNEFLLKQLKEEIGALETDDGINARKDIEEVLSSVNGNKRETPSQRGDSSKTIISDEKSDELGEIVKKLSETLAERKKDLKAKEELVQVERDIVRARKIEDLIAKMRALKFSEEAINIAKRNAPENAPFGITTPVLSA